MPGSRSVRASLALVKGDETSRARGLNRKDHMGILTTEQSMDLAARVSLTKMNSLLGHLLIDIAMERYGDGQKSRS